MFWKVLFLFCVIQEIAVGQSTNSENDRINKKYEKLLIEDGYIRGTIQPLLGGKNKSVYAFRGIPYAKPPIGDLRFEPPQKNSKWAEILNATSDKSECVQGILLPTGSEDCLYINVYTPNLEKRLPVLVWIYGGGFFQGNSSYEYYRPDPLLEGMDVIVVSFNYRLGVFGFISTGDQVAPGNAGLKDQCFALKWIQRNIKYFGGDPKKVTIFGESAGAASVSYQLQSKCAAGIDKNPLAGLAFSPVIEPPYKDAFFSYYSDQILSEGNFNQVPVIIGLNSDEAAFFDGIPALIYLYFGIYDIDPSKLAPADLTNNTQDRNAAATAINKHYFGHLPILIQKSSILKFISDDQFNRPTRRAAIQMSKYVPVYFYQFSYKGKLGRGENDRQVGHTEDVYYLFSNSNESTSDLDQLTRSRLAKLWTNFAKYRNPTPNTDPLLENIKWKETGKNPDNLIFLDINSTLQLSTNPFDRNMKFYDRIYKEYGSPPYNTF